MPGGVPKRVRVTLTDEAQRYLGLILSEWPLDAAAVCTVACERGLRAWAYNEAVSREHRAKRNPPETPSKPLPCLRADGQALTDEQALALDECVIDARD